jgi:hypothetical protein
MSDSGGGVNERVRELLAEHGTTYAPYVDDRMVEGARRAGLPDDRDALAALLEESGQPARLAATWSACPAIAGEVARRKPPGARKSSRGRTV